MSNQGAEGGLRGVFADADEAAAEKGQRLLQYRSPEFRVVAPDALRTGVVSFGSGRRIDVVFITMDQLVKEVMLDPDTGTESETSVQNVKIEEFKITLRPEVALSLARALVKSLNAIVDEAKEQAAISGITRDEVRRIGESEFSKKKIEQK